MFRVVILNRFNERFYCRLCRNSGYEKILPASLSVSPADGHRSSQELFRAWKEGYIVSSTCFKRCFEYQVIYASEVDSVFTEYMIGKVDAHYGNSSGFCF